MLFRSMATAALSGFRLRPPNFQPHVRSGDFIPSGVPWSGLRSIAPGATILFNLVICSRTTDIKYCANSATEPILQFGLLVMSRMRPSFPVYKACLKSLTSKLTHTLRKARYVALKILKPNVDPPREMDIQTHLSQYDTSHPGYTHVLTLIDHFQHTGPNGTHLCLVSEVLGPSIGELLNAPGRHATDSTRYPKTVVREISRQALLGLQYIHNAGVVHGGIVEW